MYYSVICFLCSTLYLWINSLTKHWCKYYDYSFIDGETEVQRAEVSCPRMSEWWSQGWTRGNLSQSQSFRKWPPGAFPLGLPRAVPFRAVCSSAPLRLLGTRVWPGISLPSPTMSVPEPKPSPRTPPCSFTLVLPALTDPVSPCPIGVLNLCWARDPSGSLVKPPGTSE